LVQFIDLSLGAAIILQSLPAHAQTTPDTKPGITGNDAASDEIVVSGSRPIAESEAAALEIQRNSDSLVSVAASDAVGRLPDQNIAQAASRLPGVAVQRDQGQARYINLRGAPKTWTTISLDGLTIVSPEGRDSRFDSIPSALASQIVVRKAVTPNMTGETIAGNVDIRTRTPFDYKDGRLALKMGGGQVEYGSRFEYEGSLVASKRFETNMGEIGILLAGSYYKRNMITDNFETDWEAVAQDQQPGFFDRIWARENENKLYRLTRKNYSVSGMFDFRPDDDNRVFVQSLYTAFTDDESRDNFIFDLDDRQNDNARGTAACTITPTSAPRNSGYADVCIGNTPLMGTVYGIDINQRATLRAFRQSVQTNTIGGDHTLGNWQLGWRANYTKSVDDRSVVLENRYDSPSTRNLRPTVSYNFTNPQLAQLRLFSTLANTGGTFSAGTETRNIESFARALSSAVSSDLIDVTKAYTGKLDLGYNSSLF
jgi:TonB-dependent receptor